jgi:hypothetical protein
MWVEDQAIYRNIIGNKDTSWVSFLLRSLAFYDGCR